MSVRTKKYKTRSDWYKIIKSRLFMRERLFSHGEFKATLEDGLIEPGTIVEDKQGKRWIVRGGEEEWTQFRAEGYPLGVRLPAGRLEEC